MADKSSRQSKAQADPTKQSAAAEGATAKGTPADRNAAEGKSDEANKAKASSAVGFRAEMEEREELGAFRFWLRDAVKNTPSWLVSLIFHMIVLLVLALWMMPDVAKDVFRQLVVAPGENEEFDDLEELADEELLDEVEVETEAIESPIQPENVEISPADELEAAAVKVELSEFGLERAPRNQLLATVGAYTGTGLTGRGAGARGAMVRKHGGSGGSEKAVAAALKWLAYHQCADGGWCFNHNMAPACQGKCANPGKMAKARNAATAMALLPFLGAGQTHKDGKYKPTVRDGLGFLVNRMKISPQGGALNEGGGRMYSHGLASIVLCEAYAMTHDKKLHNPAQACLNFICYAQDPVGGGWRYEPRQKGDTSVVGWQIMALKSGHMAHLRVPGVTVKKAFLFLDTAQANSGATYGYTGPGDGKATTAIGLLCRMYLGWKKGNPALERGAKQVSKWGPATGKTNMYYNYYATQVMRHWQGDLWKKWNSVMRDYLVDSQSQKDHETGSWYFNKGDHGAKDGGRLYCTSMATMVLEVYYRHMPIYQTQSTEEEFPE